MPRRPKLILRTFLIAAVAAALAVGLASSRSASVGRLAPALPRERLAGPRPASGAGRAVVVFWASWCEPCAREAPALRRFSLSAAGRGHLIGVDWSDPLAGARAFIRRYRWTFANVRDGEGPAHDLRARRLGQDSCRAARAAGRALAAPRAGERQLTGPRRDRRTAWIGLVGPLAPSTCVTEPFRRIGAARGRAA
jgi:thiol-disulfide isomerase/thioredoxin